ncbi:MAG TPA: F0F1 ATP synthase subunit alpha [Actinomycetota bacterium]|nr:F0F1 ATP synthase subunit alpha [Actinomycetota bacterium]
MSELTIRPEDIAAVLKAQVESFRPATTMEQVGRVTETGDGIARISGLPGAMANEILEFEGGLLGLALNLEADQIGAVVLGDATQIEEGDPVKATGRILSVEVGDAMLGRVVNAIGQPIDGKGPLDRSKIAGRRALELQAPTVVQRSPVNEPLQTGVKAVDAMTPVGRGQRQLIIGDRQTGKTAVAIDAIIAQRAVWGTKKQVKCVYVAIGQKASTVAEVVAALEANGAMEYTCVVVAGASDPAPFKFLAPYTGSAISQQWMYNGEHALVVYDDLSKQAEAYRELSLLLRRPAGREAYPGDVFYLHSRLLERAAKLSPELGSGSATALPIVETKGGDVSGYIPTNVISITDGQIYLVTDLFFAGVRPAINVGISVSRVGGNAQIKAMKKVAGRLRLDLAQFRELEAFAAFGSELDKASQQQLDRGARVVEILKQPQFTPMTPEDQVISIYAVTNGFMDDIPVPDCSRFEKELLEYMHSRKPQVPQTISETGAMDDATEKALREGIEDFKRGFATTEIAPIVTEEPTGPNAGWDRMEAQFEEVTE